MIRRFAGPIALLFISLWGYGQHRVSRVNHYEELNGMIITDLLADRNGELWITTFSGLLTFDGYDFRNYYPDRQDSTTIDDLLLYKLAEGSNGDIWIGSMNKIYRYDVAEGIFGNYPLQDYIEYPSNAQPQITTIASDLKGSLYFGIVSGMGFDQYPGLLKYSEKEDQFEVVSLPGGDPVHNVYFMAGNRQGEIAVISRQGFLLIGPEGTRFLEFEPLFANSPPLEGERANSIVWDNDRNLWFVTTHWRLGKFDVERLTVEHTPLPTPFNGIPDGTPSIGFDNENLWISHRDGVELFDLRAQKFSKPDNPGIRPFISFYHDGMNNIWLGSLSDGLYCIPPKQSLTSYLHNPDDPNSVTEGWVSNPFEDGEGNIWFATYNWAGEEGLNKLNPITGKIDKFLFKEKLPQFGYVQMINAYDRGKLLFRSDKKLYGYDVNTGTVLEPGLLGDSENIEYLNSVYRDSKGELWICTDTGLYRQSGDRFSLYDLSQGEMGQVVSNEVLHVLESRRGGLWVETNEGLFFLDRETDQLQRHGYDPSMGPVFSSQDINSLLEDEDGILWVGTWQGGLNRYDPEMGTMKYYGMEDGLPSPSIQGILEDKERNVLWLSTFRGLARFDKETETFASYGNEAGAQSLYADHSALELSNGLFAFGGSNGITVFDPAVYAGDTRPPVTRITGFNAGEQSLPYSGGQTISLDHSQNNISITYKGIHYDNPSKNQFSYKLLPVDTVWRTVGGSRAAYFFDLNPGDYTFSVRAASPNLVWSEPEQVSFSISPPWWQTWWAYGLYGLLLFSGGMALHRNQKVRTIRRERERTRDRELEQAREVEKAYEQLKMTQQQLVLSEKMASLGELTAGIAHEIQNPLNFVNNFSEVSAELLEEMDQDLDKGDLEDARAIARDLRQNLEKITHHGKRADGIVKGMLQHSRSSDGKMERTDINKLTDEYLRLAFHGLRAKDKTFNASMETDFDPDLPKAEVVPQDIGRVILNLLTNAFHAVNEKKRQAPQGYEPTVRVRTRKKDHGIEISVRDNGGGIPDAIKDKIFQPFFTTKPTGQGTGLGLSVSYDIVKAHGGAMRVESSEGEGTEFIVQLPVGA